MQTKEQYINHMINGNFIAFSRFGYGDEIREFIKNRVEEFSSTKQNTQEQLIKLIKPLIREKLKRKQNGKKTYVIDTSVFLSDANALVSIQE